MGILKEYKTFDEKLEWFSDFDVINTTDKLSEFWGSLESYQDLNIICRGISNAKYKQYNSAQRQFVQKNLHVVFTEYFDFIKKLVQNFKKYNPAVNKFFDKFNVPLSDIPLLAFMQHYEMPTPLLDWTKNPYVALYFACDNNYHAASENELENYFSFYTIENYDAFSIQRNFMEALDEIDVNKIKEEYQKKISDEQFEKIKKKFVSDATTLDRFLEGPPELISDEKFKTIKYYTDINFNIINQEGVFIFNPFALIPLEEAFNAFEVITIFKDIIKEERTSLQREADYNTNIKTLRDSDGGFKIKNKMKVVEIHKALIPKIIDLLNGKGINQGFIYPDLIGNGKKALEDTLKLK